MNEAELLFTQVLNCSRQDLYLNRDKPLEKKNCEFISQVFRRRVIGEPIQYILGKIEFMGLEFKVTPDVFIPRPETEILVETVINVTKTQCHKDTIKKILDIGTGSGSIAISLAKLLPEAEVVAVDISAPALKIARENAVINNTKVNFFQNDLFVTHDLRPMIYDLIVSNPPYIPTLDLAQLAPEVRYEPQIALDGGSDGLNFYRRIIKEAPENLTQNGYLILEIGFNQRQSIEKIVNLSKELSFVETIRDYSNIERVVVLKKAGVEHG